jgi:hypothetical protein
MRLSVIFMNCISRQRRQGACIIILVHITLRTKRFNVPGSCLSKQVAE